MPCLRGIEVSLTTKPEAERIPEYPHPDGTSARLLGATSSGATGPGAHRKAGPTVAVYIPSIPGTPFSINYSINTRPPAPCKYIFFRLYMNARPIAAWGIDPSENPKGKVARSLWAPCAVYDGRRFGLEGRNFVFLPGQEHKSVAEDGGLIEIQVFRAKERRARPPRLEEFRYQENYGIAAPTMGMIDEPEKACFYDWHLLDAKDSPFASFRLHYRSLKNLKQLNLIPATELELLCAVSPRALKALAKMEDEADSKSKKDESEEKPPELENSDEAVFRSVKEKPRATMEGAGDGEPPYYFLKTPPKLFPALPSSSRVPQPSKAQRDAYLQSYLQRPLPELPIEASKRDSRRLSVGSAASTTVSITPSLLQYCEEGSLRSEDVEVGVARLVQLPPSSSTNLGAVSDDGSNGAEDSISDYETSPRSIGDSPMDNKLSPGRFLPMTGSGLERGLALLASPKQAIMSRASKFRQSLPSNFTPDRCMERLGKAISNEAEWVSQSPSLGRARAATHGAHGDSSPRKLKGSGRSLFGGLRGKGFNGSPRRLAGMLLGREVAKPYDGGDAGRGDK
ncbi:hypothetical protein C8A05DRAFT_34460 [Staphylotrichum tortipilum]|uniref:Uncharacterized protein n=1 Tax=Staphylotrichum tortipilum TaxID=2831512 RepID=A0AAN6ML33_9PEZI|nr:hypothetical protein C8A05DRAFT_34460 [Staphylotrichum longicolle]